jgi:RNA polymerase sigma factor (TIGR02999 family)
VEGIINPNFPHGNLVSVSSPLQELLKRWSGGDESALNELVSLLYRELHQMAARHLRRERSGHTLQPTALVHEAYLKLCNTPDREFSGRVHFLAIASRVMRQVLVDYAKARTAKKRGGVGYSSPERVELTVAVGAKEDIAVDLLNVLQLDSALEALAREDVSLAKLVDMKYFGGMTTDETAEAAGLSIHVVRHDLRLAEAWLRRKLAR